MESSAINLVTFLVHTKTLCNAKKADILVFSIFSEVPEIATGN